MQYFLFMTWIAFHFTYYSNYNYLWQLIILIENANNNFMLQYL